MRFIRNIVYLFPLIINSQAFFTTAQKAELMISGLDFNKTGGGLHFNHPNGLATNGSNLLLCDRFNNRVLVWSNAPESYSDLPDLVIGQEDFDSNLNGSQKNQLNWPGNASLSNNGILAITDTYNDRILIWKTMPLSNGISADISIHLPSITPKGATQVWSWPWGVWTDGVRLAAVATQGGTLLFWNSIPTKDNQKPDYTISNPNFGTPRNISTDGKNYFFVGDHNAKVNGIPGTYFWNSFPTTTDQSYDFYRDEWIKGCQLNSGEVIASGIQNIYYWNSIPTNGLINPEKISPFCYQNGDGVDVVESNGKIYVCNYNGNNVLVYNSFESLKKSNPDFAIGVPSCSDKSLDSIGYIQNPAFSTNGNNFFITSDFDRRIYIYNSFPTSSGQKPDQIINTKNFNLSPWDNACYNNTFVAVGLNKICIWNNSKRLDLNPTIIFNGNIGNAKLTDLKGVALDSNLFYVADRKGLVYIWKGIPSNNVVDPYLTLNFGSVDLNRLTSDGQYFCVTQQSPPAILIFKVEELLKGNSLPWKTIQVPGMLNLPSEAITFNGSLAIANMSFHDVLLWKDINDAPATDKMIVLGQKQNSPANQPSNAMDGLFLPGSLFYFNSSLWVGEHKFSSRILRFNSSLSNGINSVKGNKSFNFWIDHLNQHFEIEFEDSKCIGSSFQIISQWGSVVHKGFIKSQRFQEDISDLPLGVYFFQIQGIAQAIQKFAKIY